MGGGGGASGSFRHRTGTKLRSFDRQVHGTILQAIVGYGASASGVAPICLEPL